MAISYWTGGRPQTPVDDASPVDWTLSGPFVFYVPAGGSPYSLVCDAASIAITGTALTMTATRTLALEPASMVITGTAMTPLTTRKLTLDAASIEITGTALGLTVGRKLALAAGAYTITGTALGLTTTRKLTLDAGSYIITGKDVSLVYSGSGVVVARLISTKKLLHGPIWH